MIINTLIHLINIVFDLQYSNNCNINQLLANSVIVLQVKSFE
jgi:hypothetical protein